MRKGVHRRGGAGRSAQLDSRGTAVNHPAAPRPERSRSQPRRKHLRHVKTLVRHTTVRRTPHARYDREKRVSPGQNDSAWGRSVGRVGLEPIGVTPLTCDDTETTDIATRLHPAASSLIQLDRKPCSVRCTAFSASLATTGTVTRREDPALALADAALRSGRLHRSRPVPTHLHAITFRRRCMRDLPGAGRAHHGARDLLKTGIAAIDSGTHDRGSPETPGKTFTV